MAVAPTWQPGKVNRFLEAHGEVLANLMVERTGNIDDMHFQPLRTREDRVVGVLKYGQLPFVIKHYSIDGDAYRRERHALGALAKSGRVPRVLFADDDRRLLVLEHITAQPLSGVITPDNALTHARALAEAVRACDRAGPSEDVSRTWLDYFRTLPELQGSKAIAAQEYLLSEIGFRQLSLARCDGALSNILVQPAGRVSLIDFQKARLKPVGWDLLLAAVRLARSFPDQSPAIADALAQGYWPGNQGQADRLAAVAKIFIAAVHFEPAATGFAT